MAYREPLRRSVPPAAQTATALDCFVYSICEQRCKQISPQHCSLSDAEDHGGDGVSLHGHLGEGLQEVRAKGFNV